MIFVYLKAHFFCKYEHSKLREKKISHLQFLAIEKYGSSCAQIYQNNAFRISKKMAQKYTTLGFTKKNAMNNRPK